MNQKSKSIHSKVFIFLFLLINSAMAQNNLKTSTDSDKDEMVRIERLVDNVQDYQLTVAAGWQPFADLKNTFEIQFSQHVIINIRISIYVNTACRMKLRVMIDGVQNKLFRRQVGETKFIMFMANQFVWMSKGKHTIQVQYLKTGADQLIQSNRINMAFFKLDYLNRKQTSVKQTKTLSASATYPLTMSTVNIWQPFPNLMLSFTLSSKREVFISYKTMILFDTPTHFATRLIIDGKQNKSFKQITGNTYFTNNFACGFVELQAGQHVIVVEYRTTVILVKFEQWDWSRNQLMVRY